MGSGPGHDPDGQDHEGNTGFYFVSPAWKPKGIWALFEAALQECRSQTKLDDQTNFWNALRTIREGHGVRKYNADSFLCARFCEQSASCKANDVQILRYCNLDTTMHPTGYWREKVWTAGTEMNRKYVSHHANYVKT